MAGVTARLRRFFGPRGGGAGDAPAGAGGQTGIAALTAVPGSMDAQEDARTPVDYLAMSQGMFADGDAAGADHLLNFAISRFPQHRGLAVRFARQAELRENWRTAAQRWQKLCETFPQDAPSRLNLARALETCGLTEQAEAALVAGFTAMGGVEAKDAAAISLMAEAAKLAQGRAASALAQQRWHLVRQAQRNRAAAAAPPPEAAEGGGAAGA